jgi:hypothetical protein
MCSCPGVNDPGCNYSPITITDHGLTIARCLASFRIHHSLITCHFSLLATASAAVRASGALVE